MRSTESIFQTITSEAALRAAWARVRSNGGGAGGDGLDLATFGGSLDVRLADLSLRLRDGSYRPGPLRDVPMRRTDGRIRHLRIPCISDRVIQTACQALLSERLDPKLSAASFGYRPSRSVDQALGAVRNLIDKRASWVFDADIAAFFDNVCHGRLMDDLGIWIDDANLRVLIGQWLRGFGDGKGLAQGAPISPLLSNIFLHPLDQALLQDGPGLVRYADDFVVLTGTRAEVLKASRQAEEVLGRRGLCLNPAKTQILPIEDGFVFLGARIVGTGARGQRNSLQIAPMNRSTAPRP